MSSIITSVGRRKRPVTTRPSPPDKACRSLSYQDRKFRSMAEQAKILVAEAEENNLGDYAFNARWKRWHACRLCEQEYHGVVACALGWACWKTYVGRPEKDWPLRGAMTLLGNGLCEVNHHEHAIIVDEAHISLLRRRGISGEQLLDVQGNLACSYGELGQLEKAVSMERDIYSAHVKRHGMGHYHTSVAAKNLAATLLDLKCYEEAKLVSAKQYPRRDAFLARTMRPRSGQGSVTRGRFSRILPPRSMMSARP